MSQTVIAHFIFDISRDRMKPVTTSNYQTAEQALEVILKANKLGQSVRVDANGNVTNAVAPSNSGVAKAPSYSYSNPIKNFFLFFRPKSKPADLQPSQQPSDVIWTVINKMKIEIGTASTFMKENASLSIPAPRKIIDKYIPNAVNIHTKAEINDLHAKWLAIQKDIADAKDGMQSSMNRLETSRYAKISKTIQKPINILEPTKKTDVVPADNSSSSRNMTAKINEALPSSIKFSGDYSKPIVFTLTLPESQQRDIFSSLTDESVFTPPDPQPDQVQKNFGHIEPDDEELKYDPFFDDDLSDDDEISNEKPSEISKQLWKDFGRATFILIDQDDFQITFDTGANPHEILQGIKSMVGYSGAISENILKTLSHLPNQTTIGAFLAPIKLQNPTPGTELFNHMFDETDKSSIKKKETFYIIKKYANGDFEFSFKKREKIENIVKSDSSKIPVNSQPQQQGDVSAENFGYEISGKIKTSEADLRNGSLDNVKIIEPVRLRYHLQFDEPTT